MGWKTNNDYKVHLEEKKGCNKSKHSEEYLEDYRNFGIPCSSDDKESSCNAGDPGSILGSGRSPEKGNGNPL